MKRTVVELYHKGIINGHRRDTQVAQEAHISELQQKQYPRLYWENWQRKPNSLNMFLNVNLSVKNIVEGPSKHGVGEPGN